MRARAQLEQQRKRKDEAYVMMDAFRIAFEQQLRRGSEKVLQLAESDTQAPEKGTVTFLSDLPKRFLSCNSSCEAQTLQ